MDGFNLDNGVHEATGRRDLWLDLERLLRSMFAAGSGEELVAVHYFTAAVTGPGRARQSTYLRALQAHGRCTTVHEGRFQRKTQRCRVCGAERSTYEEKESDVGLAVAMAVGAAQHTYDKAFLVSGDSDMLPAVRAVRAVAPGTPVVAVFPPKRSSHDLEQGVDATLRMFDRLPRRHQLPREVTTSNGDLLRRPDHWS